MLRRLILVGLMVLIEGMMQMVVGTSLAAMFLLFQVLASPYQDMGDDFLAACSSFTLVMMFICCYAFKDYELVGLPDIEAKMSNEQRDIYVADQATLAVIMTASVLGSLILSVVLFAVQFAIEGARVRREARAKQARRLRFKLDQAEVHAPAIEPGHFHTFLSHVWGTGQDQMRIVKQRLLEMIPDLHVFLDVDGNRRCTAYTAKPA